MGRLFVKQQRIENTIRDSIRNGCNLFHIEGASGCGKSYLTEHIINYYIDVKEYTVLRFVGDCQCLQRDFYPFITGLKVASPEYNRVLAVKKGAAKATHISPIGGDFLEYIAELIINRSSNADIFLNQIFSADELDLILKIKKVADQGNVIIYLDNLHWWDNKSINLLYLLFKNMGHYAPSLRHAIVLCNTTTDQEFPNKTAVLSFLDDFKFEKHIFTPLSLNEYKEFLGIIRADGYQETADDVPLDLLFNLTEGHLEITKKAVVYKEKPNHIKVAQQHDNNHYLNALVERRLEKLGATGEQISELLEYAALIGLSFSFFELEYLMRCSAGELRYIIEKAKKISLIESKASRTKYHFSHEVIRELFEKKSFAKVHNYYPQLVNCFKELYPTEYLLRIKYLLKIGDIHEVEKLYCLDAIQQLTLKGDYNPDLELEVLLEQEFFEYIENFKKAIQLHQKGKYAESAQELCLLENIYPIEMIAERDMWVAQNYTKLLDEKNRLRAVELLEPYIGSRNSFQEQQIWSTAMLVLFDAYIHIGKRDSARKIQQILYDFYSTRIRASDEYRRKLNVLRRKAPAVYELETSLPLLQKSAEFFGQTDENNYVEHPVDYYITLVNYSSVLICSGSFNEGYSIARKAIELTQKYYEISFPRCEAIINNFVMASCLSGKLSFEKGAKFIHDILGKLNGAADIYFLKSNYAIYLMNIGEIRAAQAVLQTVFDEINVSTLREPSYIYHGKVNYAIGQILLRDFKAAQKTLEDVRDIVPHIHYASFYQKRHTILEVIIQKEKEYSYKTIPHAIFEECPHYQSPAWNYFGLVYSYNTLEQWGES